MTMHEAPCLHGDMETALADADGPAHSYAGPPTLAERYRRPETETVAVLDLQKPKFASQTRTAFSSII